MILRNLALKGKNFLNFSSFIEFSNTMAQLIQAQLEDFNQYCQEELSRVKTVTISKEKGRRLVHYIKTKEVLPPLPDTNAPGPTEEKQFVKYFKRHNFEIANDPELGVVDELRVREGGKVSHNS